MSYLLEKEFLHWKEKDIFFSFSSGGTAYFYRAGFIQTNLMEEQGEFLANLLDRSPLHAFGSR